MNSSPRPANELPTGQTLTKGAQNLRDPQREEEKSMSQAIAAEAAPEEVAHVAPPTHDSDDTDVICDGKNESEEIAPLQRAIISGQKYREIAGESEEAETDLILDTAVAAFLEPEMLKAHVKDCQVDVVYRGNHQCWKEIVHALIAPTELAEKPTEDDRRIRKAELNGISYKASTIGEMVWFAENQRDLGVEVPKDPVGLRKWYSEHSRAEISTAYIEAHKKDPPPEGADEASVADRVVGFLQPSVPLATISVKDLALSENELTISIGVHGADGKVKLYNILDRAPDHLVNLIVQHMGAYPIQTANLMSEACCEVVAVKQSAFPVLVDETKPADRKKPNGDRKKDHSQVLVAKGGKEIWIGYDTKQANVALQIELSSALYDSDEFGTAVLFQQHVNDCDEITPTLHRTSVTTEVQKGVKDVDAFSYRFTFTGGNFAGTKAINAHPLHGHRKNPRIPVLDNLEIVASSAHKATQISDLKTALKNASKKAGIIDFEFNDAGCVFTAKDCPETFFGSAVVAETEEFCISVRMKDLSQMLAAITTVNRGSKIELETDGEALLVLKTKNAIGTYRFCIPAIVPGEATPTAAMYDKARNIYEA